MFEYKDRVALVTGAGRGIGRGIAETFAKAGARVMVAALEANEVQAVVEAIRAEGGEATAHPVDVADAESVQRLLEATRDAFGSLDVLCCNAGIYPSAELESMTEEEWDQMLDVNLKGTFLTVREALPLLKQSDAGRIVLTSSVTGPITGYAGWAHYGASKAGQLGFMRSAALEFAPHGITINAVQPGNILTEGLQEQGEAYLKEITDSIPLKRLGSPEDIAYAALFLGSREAGYITGQTLVIDGGQILPE